VSLFVPASAAACWQAQIGWAFRSTAKPLAGTPTCRRRRVAGQHRCQRCRPQRWQAKIGGGGLPLRRPCRPNRQALQIRGPCPRFSGVRVWGPRPAPARRRIPRPAESRLLVGRCQVQRPTDCHDSRPFGHLPAARRRIPRPERRPASQRCSPIYWAQRSPEGGAPPGRRLRPTNRPLLRRVGQILRVLLGEKLYGAAQHFIFSTARLKQVATPPASSRGSAFLGQSVELPSPPAGSNALDPTPTDLAVKHRAKAVRPVADDLGAGLEVAERGNVWSSDKATKAPCPAQPGLL
jgi:hypothetical protein